MASAILDGVIGVHCTHGVNRTGYFICRYMIEHMRVSPDSAVSAFQEARGHAIERNNYVKELRTICLNRSTVNSSYKVIAGSSVDFGYETPEASGYGRPDRGHQYKPRGQSRAGYAGRTHQNKHGHDWNDGGRDFVKSRTWINSAISSSGRNPTASPNSRRIQRIPENYKPKMK